MRNRYSLDSNNQLLILASKQKRPILANGGLSIDDRKRLVYWLNEPSAWRRQYSLPGKISFIGNWRLGPNYDLELVLDETKNQLQGNRLVLKGEIISVDNNTLIFQVITRNENEGQVLTPLHKRPVPNYVTHIQLLKLGGFWQADEYNRLSFVVQRRPSPDILTLEGAWQINKNQQITYVYEKTDLKTKTKIAHNLTFEGFWQMNSANKLTYILSRSLESRFDFRVQVESPNLYPKAGAIKYRVGIGLKEGRQTQTKIISLYGAWKFSRKLGLIFQMDYGRDRVKSIEFGTDISLTKKDNIAFALKNKKGEPLGINLTFTRRFLRQLDAELFLRLSKSIKQESGIETGVRIPF